MVTRGRPKSAKESTRVVVLIEKGIHAKLIKRNKGNMSYLINCILKRYFEQEPRT